MHHISFLPWTITMYGMAIWQHQTRPADRLRSGLNATAASGMAATEHYLAASRTSHLSRPFRGHISPDSAAIRPRKSPSSVTILLASTPTAQRRRRATSTPTAQGQRRTKSDVGRDPKEDYSRPGQVPRICLHCV